VVAVVFTALFPASLVPVTLIASETRFPSPRILRRVRLILSVPILGDIDGPRADRPRAPFATRYAFVSIVVC
jgi:hypothetical protein